MKLPSIEYLTHHTIFSFLRFPLTILSAVVAVVMGIYIVEYYDDLENIFPYINIMLCSGLGIPLFFCTKVLVEKRNYTVYRSWGLYFFSATALVLLYFTLPTAELTQNTSLPYIRYGIYNITIHLCVSFVPFIGSRQLNGFWNYNKILFIRFWTSILYSGFIYVGLTMALVALKLLFDVNIHETLYIDLYIVIIGLFNTWFFVAGIPVHFETLDTLEKYPTGLKVFTQYVLLPLLMLYLFILYGYGAKIIALWDWPKGIVSYLITCVAVLGILTVLLIYPYSKLPANGWIKKVSKGYYVVLLPLILILFIAIGMRINDYGITINRYVIVLLGVWLSITCCYFIVGKTNIKFIPTSLAVILLLMSFGPWSMFSVSERSQSNRLKSILEASKIIQAGKVDQEVVWIKDSIPTFHTNKENTHEGILIDSLHNEVKSILDYLDHHHGFSSVKTWYTQDLDSMITLANQKKSRWQQENEAEIYMRTLGLKYEYRDTYSKNLYFSYYSDGDDLIRVRDYDYVVPFNQYYDRNKQVLCSFHIDTVKYTLEYTGTKDKTIDIKRGQEILHFNVDSLTGKLLETYSNKETTNIKQVNMQLNKSMHDLDFKIEFKRIGFDGTANALQTNSLSGNLFIKLKSKQNP